MCLISCDGVVQGFLHSEHACCFFDEAPEDELGDNDIVGANDELTDNELACPPACPPTCAPKPWPLGFARDKLRRKPPGRRGEEELFEEVLVDDVGELLLESEFNCVE